MEMTKKKEYLGVDPELIKAITEDEHVSTEDAKSTIFLTQLDKDCRADFPKSVSKLINKLRAKIKNKEVSFATEHYPYFKKKVLEELKTEEKGDIVIELASGEKGRIIIWQGSKHSAFPFEYRICVYTTDYKYIEGSDTHYKNREDLVKNNSLYLKYKDSCEVEERQ